MAKSPNLTDLLPQILVKLRLFGLLESSEPKLLLQRPPLKSDFPCKWAEKNICIFFDFVLLSSDYLEIQFFREIEFSTFTDICFRYQGTLRVQKPLRSQMGKFDSRFYGSGTMWPLNLRKFSAFDACTISCLLEWVSKFW